MIQRELLPNQIPNLARVAAKIGVEGNKEICVQTWKDHLDNSNDEQQAMDLEGGIQSIIADNVVKSIVLIPQIPFVPIKILD